MSKIIGIDLGTTNSLVAVTENGVPRILKDRNGQGMVPSVVAFPAGSLEPVVGSEAKPLKVTDPIHTAYSVKRLIGKGAQDVAGLKQPLTLDTRFSTATNVLIKLGKRNYTPVEISGLILQKLKQIAEENLKEPVTKTVITVPAYFNDAQRNATVAAGAVAGLEVVRIVNEPTAASLAYGLDRKKSGLIAVYDLGGGTFDISVLRLREGIFEVLATNGDMELGGDDFDQALFNHLRRELENEGIRFADDDMDAKAGLLSASELIKHRLSSVDSVKTDINGVSITVTRAKFEEIIKPIAERTLAPCQQVLQDAKLRPEEISDVVMVGGSTRVPLIQKIVKDFFGRTPNTSINPDEVVALGAAIQADILAGYNKDAILLDVIPLSLGIETYGGTTAKIILRNTKIPTVAHEAFTTHVDNQKHVSIHVVQGEREMAQDCRSLARFELRDLEPLPAGMPKIKVTFLIDANGILCVSALDLRTNKEANIEVRPTFGLTDKEVEQMVSESYDKAEADMAQRQLADTRVEADSVIHATEKILRQAEQALLPTTLLTPVKNGLEDLRGLREGDDHIAIRDQIARLDETAKPLLEKVMNAALAEAVTHKTVDQVLNKGKE